MSISSDWDCTQHIKPISVRVSKACEISGLGTTSIWSLLKAGKLKQVHIPGVRRTLINYASLERLLAPATPETPPLRRPRGRPKKIVAEK